VGPHGGGVTPREARAEGLRLQRALRRIVRADERTLTQVASDAGINERTLDKLSDHSVRLQTLVALADAVGYEVVLRRRRDTPDV